MGEGEGGEEAGLTPFFMGAQTQLPFRRCYQIQRTGGTQKPAHGPFDNIEYSSSSFIDGYGVRNRCKWEQPLLPN